MSWLRSVVDGSYSMMGDTKLHSFGTFGGLPTAPSTRSSRQPNDHLREREKKGPPRKRAFEWQHEVPSIGELRSRCYCNTHSIDPQRRHAQQTRDTPRALQVKGQHEATVVFLTPVEIEKD